MKRLNKCHIVIYLLGLVFYSTVVSAGPPENWEFLDYDKALKAANQTNSKVFVYFGRFGCPTCERVNHEAFVDERVIKRLNENYVLAYVDSESGDRLRLPNGERITEMDLGIRLKVFGTPFFYFMEADGTVIVRAPGYRTANDFLTLDEFVNEGHYKEKTIKEFLTEKL